MNLLSNHIETGFELVLKTCDCIYDFDNGIKKYYHEGIQVGEEKMSASDYEVEIEFE